MTIEATGLACQALAVEEARSFASVTRVHARLRKLLEPALNAKPFWIRAELSSVSQGNGRLYCDLVEMRSGRVAAKMRCTIWPRELTVIRARLDAAQLSELLADGNEVGLLCCIQYHELYGMSVTAVDIDPSESLGALERKRQEIILRLREEGLLEKNAEHSVPALPQRVGLIASRDTAGYKDFVSTVLGSGFGIQIVAADARVEGDDAQRSILLAMTRLASLHVDVVIILRGGGSRISLSYMDNEAIARAIAAYPLPVWTAIGHDIDTSVLDAVAHTSFKTPTAVAENLVARYVEAHERLRAAEIRLRRHVRDRLRPERERVDGSTSLLISMTRRLLRESRGQSESRARTFRLLLQKRVSSEHATIQRARSELRILAKRRSASAQAIVDQHRKSLNKTVSRAVETRRQLKERLRLRLTSPLALNRIRNEKQRSASWMQILRAADPARNLERGYALLFDSKNNLVRSCKALAVGTKLHAQLSDGVVHSTVDSTESSE